MGDNETSKRDIVAMRTEGTKFMKSVTKIICCKH